MHAFVTKRPLAVGISVFFCPVLVSALVVPTLLIETNTWLNLPVIDLTSSVLRICEQHSTYSWLVLIVCAGQG